MVSVAVEEAAIVALIIIKAAVVVVVVAAVTTRAVGEVIEAVEEGLAVERVVEGVVEVSIGKSNHPEHIVSSLICLAQALPMDCQCQIQK